MSTKIYNDLFAEFQKEGIVIREVSTDELKRHSSNSDSGFINYECNGDVFNSAFILVDCSISIELKINVLLHEFGHYLHYKKIGCDQAKQLQQNVDNWIIVDEFEAFKFQLIKVYTIAIDNDINILRNTMLRLIDRFNNDSDLRYREALNRLFQDEIWQKAKKLTGLSLN